MKSIREFLVVFVLPLIAGILTWVVVGSFGGIFVLVGLIAGIGVVFFGFIGGIYAAMYFSEEDERKKRNLQTEKDLSGLVASSTSAIATLPQLLRDADCALDAADREFAEGAFAPFWDAVETAANRLAAFHNTVEQVVQNADFYRKESGRLLGHNIPPFQLDLGRVPAPRTVAGRMREIVRAAQRNFQFATIYEQLKANQLLVAGFSTLGQAIVELGGRLDTALDMLDNIQRGRKPSDPVRRFRA